MEYVRSTTTMMSTGLEPHGEHAVADAFSLIELMPTTFAKKVGTVADSSTAIAFAGLQPGIDARHFAVTFSETATPFSLFLPEVPYAAAMAVLAPDCGSSCAPARAAASAD